MRITFDTQLETAPERSIMNVHIFTIYFYSDSNGLGKGLPLVQSGICILEFLFIYGIF